MCLCTWPDFVPDYFLLPGFFAVSEKRMDLPLSQNCLFLAFLSHFNSDFNYLNYWMYVLFMYFVTFGKWQALYSYLNFTLCAFRYNSCLGTLREGWFLFKLHSSLDFWGAFVPSPRIANIREQLITTLKNFRVIVIFAKKTCNMCCFFSSFNSLNIMEDCSQTCSSCRKILMLLSTEGSGWFILILRVTPRICQTAKYELAKSNE